PAKRSTSFTEKGSDVFRHESGDSKGFGDPGLDRLSANIIAVLERHRASLLKLQKRVDVQRDRFLGSANVFLRLFATQKFEIFIRMFLDWHIAVERVMGGGLIGQHVGDDAVAKQ